MSYIYEGDKIKLNEKDFNKLQNMFQNINLRSELDVLDMELREEKKYWMPMMSKLRYRNNNTPVKKTYSNEGNVAYVNRSLSGRTEAATRSLMAQKDSDSLLGSNEPLVRLQVDKQ